MFIKFNCMGCDESPCTCEPIVQESLPSYKSKCEPSVQELDCVLQNGYTYLINIVTEDGVAYKRATHDYSEESILEGDYKIVGHRVK